MDWHLLSWLAGVHGVKHNYLSITGEDKNRKRKTSRNQETKLFPANASIEGAVLQRGLVCANLDRSVSGNLALVCLVVRSWF